MIHKATQILHTGRRDAKFIFKISPSLLTGNPAVKPEGQILEVVGDHNVICSPEREM